MSELRTIAPSFYKCKRNNNMDRLDIKVLAAGIILEMELERAEKNWKQRTICIKRKERERRRETQRETERKFFSAQTRLNGAPRANLLWANQTRKEREREVKKKKWKVSRKFEKKRRENGGENSWLTEGCSQNKNQYNFQRLIDAQAD